MAQCLSCRFYVPDRPHKGKGEFWESRIGKGSAGYGAPVVKITDSLHVINCKEWKLMEKGQMKSRSVRRWNWNANNVVSLE